MFKKIKYPNCKLSHIGFIMDGNGRWATKRGLPRQVGHKQGMSALKHLIEILPKANIKYATFFAFSTENWKRDQVEIDGIFNIVRQFLEEEKKNLITSGVRIDYIGDITRFPQDLQDSLLNIVEKTRNNDKLVCIFALNYGGRWDITTAVNTLIKSGKKSVSEEDISSALSTARIPDPDLIIRTGREKRVSNFLLFQMAYSEFIFSDTLWPDFDEKNLVACLKDFSSRNRRFGGTK